MQEPVFVTVSTPSAHVSVSFTVTPASVVSKEHTLPVNCVLLWQSKSVRQLLALKTAAQIQMKISMLCQPNKGRLTAGLHLGTTNTCIRAIDLAVHKDLC